MEKIMFSLWQPAQRDAEQWRSALLGLADVLAELRARQIRVMLVDQAVAQAHGQRLVNSAEPLVGVLSLWLDSAAQLAPVLALIEPQVRQAHAYPICESEHYPHLRQQRIARFNAEVGLGQRTPGMCQVALLEKPEYLSYDQWYHQWRNGHGPNGYPLQSIFGYRQNSVVRALSADAPRVHAIVEEHFPEKAIGSLDGFYDTGGDKVLLAERQRAKGESTSRFIDFRRLDCLLTRFYQLSA